MKPQQQNKPRELAYYLTLFKIEGHQTWRTDLKFGEFTFEQSLAKNHPKITDMKKYRIDKITGEITQI